MELPLELETLTVPLLCCIAILLLILILMHLIEHRKSLKTNHRIKESMDLLTEEIRHSEQQLSLSMRKELVQNLQQLNESLIGTFGQITRSQSEQVNAIIRQSYDNAQAADQRQQGMHRMIDENMQRGEMRIESMRKTMDENMRLLREENTKKLSEMRATVDEKLNDTLEKRLNSSFAQVSERLEQVYKSLGEVHGLASGVGDLKKMLSNVKTRGIWGEVQLGALIEQVMTESQYDVNVTVVPGSSERVEFAIRLPGRDADGKAVYLPIDSKFPQEDYARLVDASQEGNPEAIEVAQKALLNTVKTEAKRIGKYIAPPHTTDFAVMFLPLEGLYAEVVRHTEVIDVLQREYRILISGPSTLVALLNSLHMGFRTLAIEQRSAEVWKLLGAVKNDFGSFAKALEATQNKLQQATVSIDSAFAKTRKIEKHLRSVELLDSAETQKLLSDD